MASVGIRLNNNGLQNGGLNIGCCRVCTCVNFGFLSSKIGLLKIFEVIVTSICESVLIRYGIPHAASIGKALTSFLTATACCFTTTVILMICYSFSDKSFHLIRQSAFEVLFNGFACTLYLSASSYMGFATVVWLYPQFLITPGFWAYPAMSLIYWLGYLAAVLYGLDAYFAFRQFRGYR